MKKTSFITKDDDSSIVEIAADEISETVPDADMRFTLVILKDGSKHFVKGTEHEINEKLTGRIV